MEWLHHPLARAALLGIVTAAVVDYRNFKGWKSVSEALAYNWGTALWRWFQGAVTGVMGALGLDAIGL